MCSQVTFRLSEDHSPLLCHLYSPSFKHTPLPACPIPHFPNLSSLMAFCGPGRHAWDSPFGVLCTLLTCPCSVLLNITTNWLFHNSTMTCLDYKEGALERHTSTAVLPHNEPLPVATTLPAADAAHSLGIHSEERSSFPSLPAAFLSPRLDSALE